eukprot:g2198.t1
MAAERIARTAPRNIPPDAAHVWAPEDVTDPGIPGAAFSMFLGNITAQGVQMLPVAALERSLKELLRWPGDVRVLSTAAAPVSLSRSLTRKFGCISFRLDGLEGDQSEKQGEYWLQSWGRDRGASDWNFGRRVYRHAHDDGRDDWLYWGAGELSNGAPVEKSWLISNAQGGRQVSLVGRGVCRASCDSPEDVPVWFKQNEVYKGQGDDTSMRPTFIRTQARVTCMPFNFAIVDVRLELHHCDGKEQVALQNVGGALRRVLDFGGSAPFSSALVKQLRAYSDKHPAQSGTRVMFSGIYENRLRTRSCAPKIKLFDATSHRTLEDVALDTSSESRYDESKPRIFRNHWLSAAELVRVRKFKAASTRDSGTQIGSGPVNEHAPCMGCCDQPIYAAFCKNYKLLGWCSDAEYRARCSKTCGACSVLSAAFDALAAKPAPSPVGAFELKFGLNIPQQRKFGSSEKRSLVLALVRGGLGLSSKFAEYVTILRATMRQFTRYFGSMGLHVQLQMRIPTSMCTADSAPKAKRGVLHLVCMCVTSAPVASSTRALSQPCGALQARMQGRQFAHDTEHAAISHGYRILLGAGMLQVTGLEALARALNDVLSHKRFDSWVRSLSVLSAKQGCAMDLT